MANSLATLYPVEFAGSTLYVVDHEGKPFAPMKAIVEAMGLDWSAQHAKLKANQARWGMGEIAIPSNGGIQSMICIALYKLAGWLTSISPNKIKDLVVRDRVIKYQNECDTALWDYWNTGHAVRQNALPEYISPEQCQHLTELVNLVVESGRQKNHGETWARFHSKMKVNKYSLLHPSKFDAACEYLRGKMDDASIAAIAAKHFPEIVKLAAPQQQALPAPAETPCFKLDVQTLAAMLTGGMVEKPAMLDIANSLNKALFLEACNNPNRGYGQEVADKIKDLNWSDLHVINQRASMEVWLRSQFKGNAPALPA